MSVESLLEGWQLFVFDDVADDENDLEDPALYRDRFTFCRDDAGDWWAVVQHRGRGYMYGTQTFRVPVALGEWLDSAHALYGTGSFGSREGR